MIAREGGRLPVGEHGRSRVVRREAITAADVLGADQVLVGTNRTRRLYNRRIRALKGFEGELPVVGDKLVCLRNDRQKGLLNGGLWRVESVRPKRKEMLRYMVAPEEATGSAPARIAVLPEFFTGEGGELPWARRRESDEFDFGYALTVHKAQGSQWDSVVLFDESFAFREHRARWLYTGVTRAAGRLAVVT
jgi:exodeoxyribonuclease-5